MWALYLEEALDRKDFDVHTRPTNRWICHPSNSLGGATCPWLQLEAAARDLTRSLMLFYSMPSVRGHSYQRCRNCNSSSHCEHLLNMGWIYWARWNL